MVVIYDDTNHRPAKDDRIRHYDRAIELRVGKQHAANIRGTNKLYIVRGDELQIYDLATTDESAIEEASIIRANDADEYVAKVIDRFGNLAK